MKGLGNPTSSVAAEALYHMRLWKVMSCPKNDNAGLGGMMD